MDKVEEKNSVEQGNKIIAEFDNWEQVPEGIKEKFWKYHSSWNWLMPVYCKLNQVKMVTSLRLHWGKLMGTTVRRLIECDISGAQKAIVKAIQWYNANTETKNI